MADELSKKHVLVFDADNTSFVRKIIQNEKKLNDLAKSAHKVSVGASKSFGDISTSFKAMGKINVESKKIDDLGTSVSKVSQKVKLADGTVGTFATTTKRLADGTQLASSEFKRASGSTESYTQAMDRLFKRAILTIPVWTLLRATIMGFNRLVKSSVKFLIDWEYQLAQIAIVGKATKGELESLSGVLIKVAKDFGISYKDLGEGAKLFAQQGRAMEEIIPLMRTTAKLSLLTGNTIVQSVEDLTAILKAYNLEAKDSITIVDSMTNVMTNHAVTAQDLAKAYKQVASTASALGVSFESLTGYITAIKAVTRDAGGKIGLSLRTMFSRITTSSAKAIQNLASVPLYLDSAGRSTFAVTPRFRNLDSIISELSLKFNKLGNAQKSQLANLVGGVRRQNQVFALFTNFTEAVQAQQDALFGLGKASSAIDILTDTSKVGIEKMKNAWFGFIEAIGDSDAIKGTLTLLTNLISGVTKALKPQKALYKENLNTLSKQNDKYARQLKFVDGIAKNMMIVEQINKQSLRASEDQNKILDERANIIRKSINEAAKNQGVNIKISQTGGLSGLDNELKQIKAVASGLKLDSIVGQQVVNLKTKLLSTGQTLGGLIDSFEKFATRKAGTRFEFEEKGLRKIRQQSKELYTQIIRISDSVRKGLVVPDEAFSGLKNLITEYGNFNQKDLNFLERKITAYQDINAKLSDRNKLKDEVIEKAKTLKEFEDNIVVPYEKQQTINKAIIQDQLERLKHSGALTSEILKAEGNLKKQFHIEETIQQRIKRQLALQRELTKERRLQGKYGSESIKIYDIAQKKGADVAKKIADVLAGNTDFATFVKEGGEELEVFKKEFADLFKQQQAEAFFQGNTIDGVNTLRGGSSIDIQERGLRKSVPTYNAQAQLLSSRLQQQEKNTLIGRPSTQATFNVPIDVGVNVSVDATNLTELQEQVEAKIAKNLPKVGSEVNKGLTKAIYGNQSNRL